MTGTLSFVQNAYAKLSLSIEKMLRKQYYNSFSSTFAGLKVRDFGEMMYLRSFRFVFDDVVLV